MLTRRRTGCAALRVAKSSHELPFSNHGVGGGRPLRSRGTFPAVQPIGDSCHVSGHDASPETTAESGRCSRGSVNTEDIPTSPMKLYRKLRGWLGYFYRLPWAVPAWGWNEFRTTVGCVTTGRIVNGSCPRRLATAIKEELGIEYAIPVNRGRTAIELGLRAMGIGSGDVVVLPSYICKSALEGVVRTGAKPAFADVGDDLNVTAATVEAAITPNTKCVLVAHLFGNPAPIDEIELVLSGTGIALMDDAAQALGAQRAGRPVGTFGRCGIVSCGPGKPLAAAAGGLLLTADPDLYEAARTISLDREGASLVAARIVSFWIWRRFRKYTLPLRAFIEQLAGPTTERPHAPATMSNLDAAIALHQFTALATNAKRRHRNADMLVPLVTAVVGDSASVLAVRDTLVKLIVVLPEHGASADETIRTFAALGVECQRGYTPCHRGCGEDGTGLPVTNAVWERIVCVPVDTPFRPNRRASLLQGGRACRSTEPTISPRFPAIGE